MSQTLKNFIRTYDNIILLVCDYYETKQIPQDMIDIKGNISMFPVANIPLIDYIIKSLISQSLTNIILCGKSIGMVYAHVAKAHGHKLNMIMHENEASLGDVLRYFNEVNYELKDMLILYSNHYTNYNLNNLFEIHIKNDNLVTFFMHENRSNICVNHLYGTKDDQIVYYDRVVNDKINNRSIKEALEKNGTINFLYKRCSPNIAVISPKVFKLFTDNFDYNYLGDLLNGLIAFNPFNLKIGYASTCTSMLPEMRNVYSREILTLYDYYTFNEDNIKYRIQDISEFSDNDKFFELKNSFFFELPKGFDVEDVYKYLIENTVFGYNNKLQDDGYIKDSFVGNGCVINGKVTRCILWDGVNVNEDMEEIIVIGNDIKINIYHLEEEKDGESTESDDKERTNKGSFFDDIINYLNESIEGIDIEEGRANINFDSIRKQIKIIKIIWNASNLDFIEAFIIFLIDLVHEDDMEGSTINASVFFPLLEGNINCIEDQEDLLKVLYDLLLDGDFEFRKQVLFRYGYLFIEDGIIIKSVLKKYNKMMKRGEF